MGPTERGGTPVWVPFWVPKPGKPPATDSAPWVYPSPMAGGVEREDVFAAADSLRWRVDDRPNRNGYFKMQCPCGQHTKWLHKTPSNPHYYREYIAKMQSLGCHKRTTS